MSSALWITWEKTVAAAPAAPAAVDPVANRTWSRADLLAEAKRLAGLAPERLRGVVVAFAEINHPRWLAVFLALQKAGAIALPLDAALPRSQQGQTARAFGAQWLLADHGQTWIALETEAAATVEGSPTRPEDACLVKTSSGTTGGARALIFTADNMLADGRQVAASMEIGAGDRNLGAIPFGHSYGLGNLVMPLIIQGTAVICSSEILPNALAGQIEAHHATVFPSVPVVLRALAESAVGGSPQALRSLRRVISAGAPLRPEVAAKFHENTGLRVHNFYGSSETGGICFDRSGEATLTGRGVGTALDGVGLDLGEEGRVIVRGAAVMAPGIWTLPDLGRWNEFGELALSGRATAVVNIGGKKVAPSEVEQALRSLEAVTDAWVGVQARGGKEAHGENYLVAAVETLRNREAILRSLADSLPAWQIPRRLWVMECLPRTDRGKPDRVELERLSRE